MSPENIALGDSFKRRLSAWSRPELQSLTIHRLSHYLYTKRLRWFGRLLSMINRLLHRVNISPQSVIGPGCRFPHPAGVSFHCRAGRGLTIYSMASCCTDSGFNDGPLELGPTLGDNVTLGGHATIVGPVCIGSGVTVAFNTVVSASDAIEIPNGKLVFSAANHMRVRSIEETEHQQGKTA